MYHCSVQREVEGNTDVSLAIRFIPLPIFKRWKVKFEIWPDDILLRADKGGAGVPAAEFLRMLANLEDEPDTAAFRWDRMISDANCGWSFSMQSLPATSTYLCGKPALRKQVQL